MRSVICHCKEAESTVRDPPDGVGRNLHGARVVLTKELRKPIRDAHGARNPEKRVRKIVRNARNLEENQVRRNLKDKNEKDQRN
jgi:hypothetical protein